MIITAENLNAAEKAKLDAAIAAAGNSTEQRTQVIASAMDAKACKVADVKWEAMVSIVGNTAIGVIADVADAANDPDIQPLKVFAEDYKARQKEWVVANGLTASDDIAEGFQQALGIVLNNADFRNKELDKFNASAQKKAKVNGEEVIIKTMVSKFTGKALAPLSKRDLTAQLTSMAQFLGNNPGSFSLY